jgi:single-stranded-DNA-specific exonuclease
MKQAFDTTDDDPRQEGRPMDCNDILTRYSWNVLDRDSKLEEALCRSLPVSPTLCRILMNRGIATLEDAERFLNPELDDLLDPCLLDGIAPAIARTRKAIDSGEKIMVHGDYDVDGVTSTALMVRVLRLLKADVSWYIPHRQKEGYDIGRTGVEEAKRRGVGLIVTVDCGTSAVDAIEYAKGLGIDVIVTDHHEVGKEVASAFATINPRKPGCPYPFKDLAGVGVAYKFAEALVRECGYDVPSYRRKFCDLAAIGTVADVVPLVGENRILVKFGMKEMPRTGKKGLRALLGIAGLTDSHIESQMLAFAIGPRLNAAGRLDDASLAVRLLLTTSESEAVELANELELKNRERQAEQERITGEAIGLISESDMDETAKVLVLSSQRWHPGIVGIVASKITERYHRPSIMVAMGESGEFGVGSARSIPSFDVFDALMQCRHLLERCGGHAHAAGLSIAAEKLPVFRTEINRIADSLLTDDDMVPRMDVDLDLELESITREFVDELHLLEPYGHGNRQPVFRSNSALIQQKFKMGSTGAHLKLKLGMNDGRMIDCVAFGWGEKDAAFRLGSLIDVCYNIQVNRFNGSETIQAVLKDASNSAL